MPWDALGVLRAKGPPIVGHLRSQNLHRLEGLVGLVPGNQKKRWWNHRPKDILQWKNSEAKWGIKQSLAPTTQTSDVSKENWD